MQTEKIELLAAKIRRDILKMLQHRGYGHVGGSLSIVELLSVLYGHQMKIDPSNPKWSQRDYLILSKGHAGPALYATLANTGFINREDLFTLNDSHTNYPSHPDRLLTKGVDMTTGSLGQGTSVAAGLAKSLKLDNAKQMVYLIVGDGELNEGQCWEAFQFIAHNKLNNCLVIIDDNKKQLDGLTSDIMNQHSIHKKMEAFGFKSLTVKGDSVTDINNAINQLKLVEDQAVCIVLDSIKGQGVQYFEELEDNHSVKFTNNEINTETEKAIERLTSYIEGFNNVQN